MGSRDDRKQMWKEAGILFGITLLSGLILGVVHGLTKEPIRLQQEKAVQEACAAAFPAPGNLGDGGDKVVFVPVEYRLDGAFLEQLSGEGVEIGSVFRAAGSRRDASAGVSDGYGWVVEAVSGEGYGGDIVLYVGVDNEGTVTGVSILELSETAGLGMEAPAQLAPQFAGKQVERFTYTKTGAASDSEVDAITSATVTTSAVVDAVNAGLQTARYLMENPGQCLGVKGGDGDE